LWSPVDPILPALPPPPGAGALRDAYNVPNVVTSENFALRWGNTTYVDPAQVDVTLDALEDAWRVQIDEMQHSRPYGTEQYLFNVYIGDTGNGAPPGYGAAGYYTTDRDGWPMIVIARDSLEDSDWTRITASHEFYHAVQGATERYNYDPNGPSAWFWEATATWASQVVYPENGFHAVFLYGYAFLPHRRVNFFDYPDTGVLQEYFQYGAFLFAVSVSETTGSPQAIRDVWEDPGTNPDPLEVLRAGLLAEGFDLNEVWTEHVARNALMDYPNQDTYRAVLGSASGWPESENVVVGALSGATGSDGWRSPPAGLRPERYGSNRWTISPVNPGEYRIRVQGEPTGTYSSPSSFSATLIVEDWGEDPQYIPIPFDGVSGELRFEATGAEDRLHLVVGAWTPALNGAWNVEVFPYQVAVDKVESEPEPVPAPEERRACGCEAGSQASAVPWALWAVVLMARRRGRA
jgi:hypothetical protein